MKENASCATEEEDFITFHKTKNEEQFGKNESETTQHILKKHRKELPNNHVCLNVETKKNERKRSGNSSSIKSKSNSRQNSRIDLVNLLEQTPEEKKYKNRKRSHSNSFLQETEEYIQKYKKKMKEGERLFQKLTSRQRSIENEQAAKLPLNQNNIQNTVNQTIESFNPKLFNIGNKNSLLNMIKQYEMRKKERVLKYIRNDERESFKTTNNNFSMANLRIQSNQNSSSTAQIVNHPKNSLMKDNPSLDLKVVSKKMEACHPSVNARNLNPISRRLMQKNQERKIQTARANIQKREKRETTDSNKITFSKKVLGKCESSTLVTSSIQSPINKGMKVHIKGKNKCEEEKRADTLSDIEDYVRTYESLFETYDEVEDAKINNKNYQIADSKNKVAIRFTSAKRKNDIWKEIEKMNEMRTIRRHAETGNLFQNQKLCTAMKTQSNIKLNKKILQYFQIKNYVYQASDVSSNGEEFKYDRFFFLLKFPIFRKSKTQRYNLKIIDLSENDYPFIYYDQLHERKSHLIFDNNSSNIYNPIMNFYWCKDPISLLGHTMRIETNDMVKYLHFDFFSFQCYVQALYDIFRLFKELSIEDEVSMNPSIQKLREFNTNNTDTWQQFNHNVGPFSIKKQIIIEFKNCTVLAKSLNSFEVIEDNEASKGTFPSNRNKKIQLDCNPNKSFYIDPAVKFNRFKYISHSALYAQKQSISDMMHNRIFSYKKFGTREKDSGKQSKIIQRQSPRLKKIERNSKSMTRIHSANKCFPYIPSLQTRFQKMQKSGEKVLDTSNENDPPLSTSRIRKVESFKNRIFQNETKKLASNKKGEEIIEISDTEELKTKDLPREGDDILFEEYKPGGEFSHPIIYLNISKVKKFDKPRSSNKKIRKNRANQSNSKTTLGNYNTEQEIQTSDSKDAGHQRYKSQPSSFFIQPKRICLDFRKNMTNLYKVKDPNFKKIQNEAIQKLNSQDQNNNDAITENPLGFQYHHQLYKINRSKIWQQVHQKRKETLEKFYSSAMQTQVCSLKKMEVQKKPSFKLVAKQKEPNIYEKEVPKTKKQNYDFHSNNIENGESYDVLKYGDIQFIFDPEGDENKQYIFETKEVKQERTQNIKKLEYEKNQLNKFFCELQRTLDKTQEEVFSIPEQSQDEIHIPIPSQKKKRKNKKSGYSLLK